MPRGFPYKNYLFGKEARDKILQGVNTLADSVACTLGARGRNVIFESDIFQRPEITNDGVTIARQGHLEDPFADAGMQAIKQSSFRTMDRAGDGTTSSIVIAREVVRGGFEAADGSVLNPVEIKKSLLKITDLLLVELLKKAQKIESEEKLIEVATVSAQDKNIGEKIGKLIWKMGKDAATSYEDAVVDGITIEEVDGMKIEGGFSHTIVKEFFDKSKPDTYDFTDCHVLVCADPIENFQKDWAPFARCFAKTQGNQLTEAYVTSLVIVCDKVDESVVRLLVENSNWLKWVIVNPPSFGDKRKDILEDLSALIGATVIDKDKNRLRFADIKSLGYCKRVTIDATKTIFQVAAPDANDPNAVKTGRASDRYLDRVNTLKALVDTVTDDANQIIYTRRYQALTGGVAVVRVAAPTDFEKREIKARVDDALFASKAALDGGVVPGGGVALLNAANAAKAYSFTSPNGVAACDIMFKACEAPFRQILLNAGYENLDELVEKFAKQDGNGIDVLTDKEVNMAEIGIVDPFKVVKWALINAISAAGSLITTQCAITNEPEEEKKERQ